MSLSLTPRGRNVAGMRQECFALSHFRGWGGSRFAWALAGGCLAGAGARPESEPSPPNCKPHSPSPTLFQSCQYYHPCFINEETGSGRWCHLPEATQQVCGSSGGAAQPCLTREAPEQPLLLAQPEPGGGHRTWNQRNLCFPCPRPQPHRPLLVLWVWQMERQGRMFCRVCSSSQGSPESKNEKTGSGPCVTLLTLDTSLICKVGATGWSPVGFSGELGGGSSSGKARKGL